MRRRSSAARLRKITRFYLFDADTYSQLLSSDGLSLAMFEALRGLRDAVAPESGNLGNNNPGAATTGDPAAPGMAGNDQQQQPNVDELWPLYQARDEYAMDLLRRTSGDAPTPSFKNKAAFVDWYTAMERKKDAALVETLAQAVLRQSAAIDQAVADLPGMHRTRAQQQLYLQELIRDNDQAAGELKAAHAQALAQRNRCRQFVQDETSQALGIEEEK